MKIIDGGRLEDGGKADGGELAAAIARWKETFAARAEAARRFFAMFPDAPDLPLPPTLYDE